MTVYDLVYHDPMHEHASGEMFESLDEAKSAYEEAIAEGPYDESIVGVELVAWLHHETEDEELETIDYHSWEAQ